ncbi:PQQ-binding-like beta-propeller repeat protein [Gaoshiqia sp. Z1-71]|uniref:outer membrane protein assembly factor BamB family protein n=1 Tax=Gaoshiqia hydrogeniformans TaxID=3290090 RepID=UPI003BF774A7
MKHTGFILFIFLFICSAQSQPIRFAHVTDIHIGSSTSVEDLELTINDINAQEEIDFVVLSGDITEFGSDEELREARELIDQLNKPWYIVPGNHDSKWSESGNNSFVRIFGYEEFSFEKNGYRFIGTASGPNMRMAPGLVPREQIVFLDSVLTNLSDPDQPVIFVNHYPLDESLSNWHTIIDLLKTGNIQATLLGHGHQNKLFHFEGIPGIMGRSNLRAKADTGGYNLVTIARDTLFYAERAPGGKTRPNWCEVPLKNHHFARDTTRWPRPDYTVNKQFPNVKTVWEIQDSSDIGTAISSSGHIAVYANTKGEVVALDQTSGGKMWSFQTSGKIYSTPAIAKNRVVCASTDQSIYCLNLKDGKLHWAFPTGKAIVASPVIEKNSVYIGSSEGIFRSIDLPSGKLNWEFAEVKNFVETRPLVYGELVYFGSWGNTFYALNKNTGQLAWTREKYSNRMLSPAAAWPVAANGKIFIVAPDRHMTAFDAKTGAEIWDSGQYTCRESIGISADGELVYIKNMNEGNVDAFCTNANEQKLAWECKADLGYEIAPSPITEAGNLVFVPTSSGMVYAIDKTTHSVSWKYKVSNALVNYILPVENRKVLVSVLDGKVVCLQY